jgi:hypothetical protein
VTIEGVTNTTVEPVNNQKPPPQEPFNIDENPGIKQLLDLYKRTGPTGWRGGPFSNVEQASRVLGLKHKSKRRRHI